MNSVGMFLDSGIMSTASSPSEWLRPPEPAPTISRKKNGSPSKPLPWIVNKQIVSIAPETLPGRAFAITPWKVSNTRAIVTVRCATGAGNVGLTIDPFRGSFILKIRVTPSFKTRSGTNGLNVAPNSLDKNFGEDAKLIGPTAWSLVPSKSRVI